MDKRIVQEMRTWPADVTHIVGCLIAIGGALIVGLKGDANGVAIAAIGAGLAGGTHYFKSRMQTPAATIEEGEEEKTS
jgi:hypothetical protein